MKKEISLKSYSEIHRLIGYCQSAKTIMELSLTQMISIKDDWFKSLLKRAESVLETMENDEAQASGGEEYEELRKEKESMRARYEKQKKENEWLQQIYNECYEMREKAWADIKTLTSQAQELAEALRKIEEDYSFLNRQIKTGTKILELFFPDYADKALTAYRDGQKEKES